MPTANISIDFFLYEPILTLDKNSNTRRMIGRLDPSDCAHALELRRKMVAQNYSDLASVRCETVNARGREGGRGEGDTVRGERESGKS